MILKNAGALKLSDPLAFAIQIEKYGLLPAGWLDPVAWLLPIGEILVGLATILGLRGGIFAWKQADLPVESVK